MPRHIALYQITIGMHLQYVFTLFLALGSLSLIPLPVFIDVLMVCMAMYDLRVEECVFTFTLLESFLHITFA